MTARDEGTAMSSSDTGLVSRHLQPVSYGVYTLVNNEAIEESAGVVLDVVSSDLIRSTATTLDTQFFQGVGAASPYRTTGLTNIVGIGNIAVTGAITLAAVLDAQAALDSAVRAAYGMKEQEDLLGFLLRLNLELAVAEAKAALVTAPGFPACVQNQPDFVTADCILATGVN